MSTQKAWNHFVLFSKFSKYRGCFVLSERGMIETMNADKNWNDKKSLEVAVVLGWTELFNVMILVAATILGVSRLLLKELLSTKWYAYTHISGNMGTHCQHP